MFSDRVIAAARECLDTPFVHQGRLLGKALDCGGLIVHVLRALQKDVVDLSGYPRLPWRHMLERHLDAQPSMRKISQLQPGCVVLMRIRRHPQHLGIWTGNTLIHAYSDVGRVVEHHIDAAWHRQITQLYEIVE